MHLTRLLRVPVLGIRGVVFHGQFCIGYDVLQHTVRLDEASLHSSSGFLFVLGLPCTVGRGADHIRLDATV